MGNRKYTLDELLIYDETSPTCLRWKVERSSGRNGARKEAKVGDIAGCIPNANKRRYLAVSIDGKQQPTHNVVWKLHFGKIPEGYEVDHINRDRHDNRIGNLRLVTPDKNARNKGMLSNNVSGINGVSRVRRGKQHYWVASWYDLDKKLCQGRYNVTKYGECRAFQLAIKRRKDEIERLNLEDAGYAETHGLPSYDEDESPEQLKLYVTLEMPKICFKYWELTCEHIEAALTKLAGDVNGTVEDLEIK